MHQVHNKLITLLAGARWDAGRQGATGRDEGRSHAGRWQEQQGTTPPQEGWRDARPLAEDGAWRTRQGGRRRVAARLGGRAAARATGRG
ncbi:hypothetical protein E2562_007425 [Oryza meyeriana var. granulata]|uniref:Uncharacterized protein n=1 Tax=Oryza meyeriana var. granulata TaxID=110450 RepID=A0A6G1CZT6_9ORYZ|nr:hypothetical protein E2562_007425 [Oryza meyeriana var. granulata]